MELMMHTRSLHLQVSMYCHVKMMGVSQEVDAKFYMSMTGSLLYIAHGTRIDIAQAVGAVTKFNANPNNSHVAAVKRIFRYL